MRSSHLFAAALSAAALMAPGGALPAGPGPEGVAFVVGFHVQPADDLEALPLPGSPDRLASAAPAPGLYDVWVFVHTRAPFVGAWSISFALDYDGVEGRGADVLGWEAFTDTFNPRPGWPAAGCGMFAGWRRFRCQQPDPYLVPGEDGWWIQPVLRLRVAVAGPDRIRLSDPEPGVRPQVVECLDEGHDLDGSESLSRVIPAVFGPDSGGAAYAPGPAAPVTGTTWGALKARGAERR